MVKIITNLLPTNLCSWVNASQYLLSQVDLFFCKTNRLDPMFQFLAMMNSEEEFSCCNTLLNP